MAKHDAKPGPRAPVGLYPQPIPVPTGTPIAHMLDDPFKVVMVRHKDDPDLLALPGGIFLSAVHKTPLQTAALRLTQKTGLRMIQPSPFVCDVRRGRDTRQFAGFTTDHCFDLYLSGAVRGEPTANLDDGIVEARFYDVAELDPAEVGYGHYQVIDHWINSLASRDSRFRFIRHDGSKIPRPTGRFPARDDRTEMQKLYPERIPILTTSWLAHHYRYRHQVLMIKLQGEQTQWCLPGGIFNWHEHNDIFDTGPKELTEESGLEGVGVPFEFALDFRRGRDLRQWCSKKTEHCCDLILSSPVRGEIAVRDTVEVSKAEFVDVFRLAPDQIGRGHGPIIDHWISAINSSGPLSFRFITD